MVIDFAVEGDRQAAVGRNLRLYAMFGIDDTQAPGAHGGPFARGEERIGDVAAMEDAPDQLPDGGFGFGPVDRDGNSTHAKRPLAGPAGLVTAD